MAPFLLLASLCAIQVPTELSLVVTPGLDIDYSDALLASVTLTDGSVGLPDKRVDFFIRTTDQEISFSPGSLLATGADGSAGPLRIRFVNGAYGVDHFVAADPDGAPYTLEARFTGDAEHAGSQALTELRLHRESVTVRLLPEHSGALGDSLGLVATLVDDNGDVDESGNQTTGRGEKPIADATVTFYIDLNDDGDFADIDELIGQAQTSGDGSARVSFDSTPFQGLPRAGLHSDAVRAEFSGDDRYKVAIGLGDLRLEPAAVDAARTLLVATPATAPADGFTRVEIDATLLDRFGNPLGPDDDLQQVVFVTDTGELLQSVKRDPISGHYQQQLQAPSVSGTAHVSVEVDGNAGATIEVVFTPGACGCRAPGGPVATAALVFMALARTTTTRRRR